MKCLACGCASFDRPAEPATMEVWHCTECGTEQFVRCAYPLDVSGMTVTDLFTGTVSVASGQSALKCLFKLKKALAFAQRFEPGRLEEQYRAGKLTWELGQFLDFEVEQAAAQCLALGMPATFEIVDCPPPAGALSPHP